jgi:MFS family permease
MVRKILAVIAGLVVANVLLALLEMAGMKVFPPPPGTDFSNPESLRAAMTQMPLTALIWVLAAQVIGTFAGAWVAARIGRTAQVKLALIVGVVETLGAIVNMLMIPHPAWFWIGSLLLLIPASLLGGRLGKSKTDLSPRATN